MKTIEKNTTIIHKTEGIIGKVLAIAHVKQNACVQFEDGYIQMMDIEEIKANYHITIGQFIYEIAA